eukprot:g14699.t1
MQILLAQTGQDIRMLKACNYSPIDCAHSNSRNWTRRCDGEKSLKLEKLFTSSQTEWLEEKIKMLKVVPSPRMKKALSDMKISTRSSSLSPTIQTSFFSSSRSSNSKSPATSPRTREKEAGLASRSMPDVLLSTSDVSRNNKVANLCATLLSCMDELLSVSDGVYEEASTTKNSVLTSVFEVVHDKSRGTVQVIRRTERCRELDTAAAEARQKVAKDIAMRYEDITKMSKQIVKLGAKAYEQEQQNPKKVKELTLEIDTLYQNISKHKRVIATMQKDLKVQVQVDQDYTRLELALDKSSLRKEVEKFVPIQDPSIYAAGGSMSSDSEQPTNSVERFDPKKGHWENLRPMQCKRWGCAGAFVYGRFLVVGGHNGADPLSSVECYDVRSQSWDSLVPMRTPRVGCAAAVLKDNLYVVGGMSSDPSQTSPGKSSKLVALSSAVRYIASKRVWEEIPPMSYKRSMPAVAVLNGELYVVGGSHSTNQIEKFNPETDTWSLLPPMKSRREQCAAVVLDERLYVLGGDDGASDLNSVERYDPILNSWTTMSPMTAKRRGLSAVVFNGILYAIGGLDGYTTLATCETYDPVDDRWSLTGKMLLPSLGTHTTTEPRNQHNIASEPTQQPGDQPRSNPPSGDQATEAYLRTCRTPPLRTNPTDTHSSPPRGKDHRSNHTPHSCGSRSVAQLLGRSKSSSKAEHNSEVESTVALIT